MANCPKCGYKFKILDWRPECPKCGVNVIYYGMEERLLDDADSAEAEHARFQKKIDRLKASFVGSKLTIIRIVLSLLPIGALFIPLANVLYSGPFMGEHNVAVNAMTIYNFVSGLNFDALFGLLGSAVVGKGLLLFALSVVFILLSVVLILVSLICLMVACGPKGNLRNITLNSLMLVFAVVSVVLFGISCGSLHSVFPDFYTASVGIGAYVYILTVVLLLGINIVIAKKGVDVKYKQCYVGGLKYEEYTEMIANGTDIEVIREKMGVAMEEKAKAEAEAAAAKAAEKAAAKAAKESKKKK